MYFFCVNQKYERGGRLKYKFTFCFTQITHDMLDLDK
jgi:hypothetical protein